jgi:small subunit ribosomal protein S2
MADDSKKVQSEEVAENVPVISAADMAIYEEMAKAGVLLGRRRSKTNPKMKPFIHTTRSGFEVIDLQKTISAIEDAQAMLKEVVKKGQLLLVAATTPASEAPANALADKYTLPRVTLRWLGGTLSNFEVMSKRIAHLVARKADKAAGRLDKYTKKERVVIDKEIERLNKLFGGLEKMTMLPGAVLVIGAEAHRTAIREANRMKIPVIAIANTDTDPAGINCLIPANDSSVTAIQYVLSKLDEAIQAGIREKGTAAKAEVKKA